MAEALDGADALVAAGFAFGGIGFPLEQFELGADAGQRGAQLVGGVGDEALLGVGGLFQAFEGEVEFFDQRADFAGGGGGVEGLHGAVLHAVKGTPDVFDGQQGMADAEPDGEPGGTGEEDQRQDQRKGQVDAQLVALAGGFGGDEDEGLAGDGATDGADADRVIAEMGVEADPVGVAVFAVGGLMGQAGIARHEAVVGAENQIVDVIHPVGAQDLLGGGREDEAWFAVDHFQVRNEGQAGVGEGPVKGLHGRLVHQVEGQREKGDEGQPGGQQQPLQQRLTQASGHGSGLRACSPVRARCGCGSRPVRAWCAGARYRLRRHSRSCPGPRCIRRRRCAPC